MLTIADIVIVGFSFMGGNFQLDAQLWASPSSCLGVASIPFAKSGVSSGSDWRSQMVATVNAWMIANSIANTGGIWIAFDKEPAVKSSSTYEAVVSQVGSSAPSAAVENNDFGATTFTWARTSAGIYTLTASAPTFTANKTVVLMSNPNAFLNNFKYTVTSTTVITFQTATLSVLSLILVPGNADALLSNTLVEVRVYP